MVVSEDIPESRRTIHRMNEYAKIRTRDSGWLGLAWARTSVREGHSIQTLSPADRPNREAGDFFQQLKAPAVPHL
jgi:hypothetical protein